MLEILKKLPDAEFDIMKVVWENNEPITTSIIMQQLERKKTWKTQTVGTLLSRLVERGFVRTEKNGKERTYFSLISKEDYLNFETSDFVERFDGNSITTLVARLFEGNKIKDSDLNQLSKWLREKKD
ncbi:BlaI/MecI/CopY family transcriptional regulator [Paenibacillus sp. FSL R7-0204]|uniref:BlaI/MecI/CopY family transcriptional regulator n=1 Tax=Paenibacillus sp. FSL R7-0204 TaxID=2921675 RepID=UPI0030FBB915